MVIASLYIFITYLAILGLGILFKKILFSRFPGLSTPHIFIMGIFPTLLILQIFHLFFKFTPQITIGFFILGLIFFLKDLKENFPNYQKTLPIIFFASILLCLTILGIVRNYDSGLYHLGNILWNFEAPIVFGLANLYWPFGHSHTLFLLNSFYFPFKDYPAGFKLINAIFFFTWFNYFLQEILENKKNLKTASYYFIILSLLPLLYFLYKQAHSPGTDLPINIFIFLVIYMLIKFFEKKEKNHSLELGPSFWISCLGISFKLSFLPIFCFTFLMTLGSVKKNKALIPFFLMGIFYLLLFIIRNVIITGCLIYPVAQTCFPHFFSWSVSPSFLQAKVNIIRSWSRIWKSDPNWVLNLTFWQWFPLWLKNLFVNYYALFFLNMVLLFPYLKFSLKNKKFMTPTNSVLSLAIFCLTFWFLTAPDPRYGIGYMTAIPLILLASLLGNGFYPRMTEIKPKYLFAGLTFIFLIILVRKRKDISIASLGKVPHMETVEWLRKDNIPFFKVANGPKDDRCWAEKIPCSPTEVINLEVIVKNGIIRELFIKN
jgi:hypothetical protein